MDEDVDFDVVPVAIVRYAHHPAVDAEAEAEAIAGMLAEHLNSVTVRWEGDGERTETDVKQQLLAWAERGDRSSVVVWLGHGAANVDGAWLATYETPQIITRSGVSPAALADLIGAQWDRRRIHDGAWILVLIEACGGATFARLLTGRLLSARDAPAPFAIVGIGGDRSAGNLGEARRMLRAALEDTYTDNDGPEIHAAELMSNLHSRVGAGGFVHHDMHAAAMLPRHTLLRSPITAPLDIYQELRTFLSGLPDDELQHFVWKAQGAEQSELAWYFTGRQAERRRIAGWLRTVSQGLLVVTGLPGSGKSALLANVLLQADARTRNLLVTAGHLAEIPAAEQPPGPFDAVVQLTGFTTGTLVARLAAALGLPVAAGSWPGSDADLLVDALRARQQPLTLLFDALDEAQEPIAIARDLLRRIAALPDTRVVLGTRAATDEDPDEPATDHRDLLDALGPPSDMMVVERDPQAIRTYVTHRLTAARDAGRLTASNAAVDEVAAAVSAGERQFLFARLAIHEILARPGILTRERPELAALLGGDHRTLFAAAVDRLTGLSPGYGELLRALALAHGRGVPRQGRIWIIVANSLTDPPGDLAEPDVDRLRVLAAPYIMVDAEDGQSVYRLAHRTYQEHFLRP